MKALITIVLSTLGIALCSCAHADRVSSLPTTASPPRAKDVEDAAVVTVYAQQMQVLMFDDDVEGFTAADEQICHVRLVGQTAERAPRQLTIDGLHRGTTSVTVSFRDVNKMPEVYYVHVESDPHGFDALASLINDEYPKANVTLVPVPTSSKVIIKGKVASAAEKGMILEMLESEDLPRGLIIDRLEVAYRAPVCCSPCCRRGRY